VDFLTVNNIETVKLKNAQSAFLKFHKIILKRIKVYQIDRINDLSDNRNFLYLTILQRRIDKQYLITSN
jgi:hypothetical protein